MPGRIDPVCVYFNSPSCCSIFLNRKVPNLVMEQRYHWNRPRSEISPRKYYIQCNGRTSPSVFTSAVSAKCTLCIIDFWCPTMVGCALECQKIYWMISLRCFFIILFFIVIVISFRCDRGFTYMCVSELTRAFSVVKHNWHASAEWTHFMHSKHQIKTMYCLPGIAYSNNVVQRSNGS